MNDIVFEKAPFDCDYLTRFAMESNAVYAYRSVSDLEAKKVFLVKREYFEKGVVKVMKRSDAIIGFFSLCEVAEETGPQNELTHLFLHPSYIGKGYGRILFQEAMQAAKGILRWRSLHWESDPFSEGFYRCMGATFIGSNPCRLNPKYRSPLFAYHLDS